MSEYMEAITAMARADAFQEGYEEGHMDGHRTGYEMAMRLGRKEMRAEILKLIRKAGMNTEVNGMEKLTLKRIEKYVHDFTLTLSELRKLTESLEEGKQ